MRRSTLAQILLFRFRYSFFLGFLQRQGNTFTSRHFNVNIQLSRNLRNLYYSNSKCDVLNIAPHPVLKNIFLRKESFNVSELSNHITRELDIASPSCSLLLARIFLTNMPVLRCSTHHSSPTTGNKKPQKTKKVGSKLPH